MPTLYDAARCPYCARVRIALAEKRVEHEVVEIDLDDRPDWLYEKNPLGKVPVFEDGGLVLPESLVILEYLDERYPEPALLPAEPRERAVARLAAARFDNALGSAYYALRRNEDGARERLEDCLGALEQRTAGWTQPFGFVDVAYVPWLVRARDLLDVDLAPFPSIADRLERLAVRPSIAAELALVAGLRQPA
jgi:glutathione S-transferase